MMKLKYSILVILYGSDWINRDVLFVSVVWSGILDQIRWSTRMTYVDETRSL